LCERERQRGRETERQRKRERERRESETGRQKERERTRARRVWGSLAREDVPSSLGSRTGESGSCRTETERECV